MDSPVEHFPERVGVYTLKRALGVGGMGTVFLAQRDGSGEEVALKLLTCDPSNQPEALKRFEREAQAAQKLDHANLVRVHDVGWADGYHFLAMEYVQGRTLSEVLATGPMSCVEAIQLAQQLLEGLQTCHLDGLLHRDLKPSNLMLDEKGRVRILDLGLVKPVNRTTLTQAGSAVGTPRYMAPEVCLGDDASVQSDLYQVGAILYECIVGKPLFDAVRLPELIESIINDPIPPIKGLPATQDALVREFLERTLAKDPGERFRSCREALACLSGRRISRRFPALVTGVGRSRTMDPRSRSSRYSVPPAPKHNYVHLVAFLVIGTLGAGSFWLGQHFPFGRRVPQSEPATCEFVEGGWRIRWNSIKTGKGLVEVRDSADAEWVPYDEEGGPKRQHMVYFQRWPGMGRSLSYRVWTEGEPPSAVQPLEARSLMAPIGLEAEARPRSITVRWQSPATIQGIVSVEDPPLTVREKGQSQNHQLTVEGLKPGTKINYMVKAPSGLTLARASCQLPRPK
jgi:serine/threonine protein kinase